MRETTHPDIAGSGSALLHVLIGESAFALALLRSTKKMPRQGTSVLLQLADQLSRSSQSVQSTARAVGEEDRLDLAIAANSAFAVTQIDLLGDKLTATATDLLTIVHRSEEGKPIDPALLDRTVDTLQRLEDAVAVMDAVPTDEVLRGDGWLTY
jgi:hypothetical protein